MKGSYLHHKQIKAAQGIKIAANGLESAVAGERLSHWLPRASCS